MKKILLMIMCLIVASTINAAVHGTLKGKVTDEAGVALIGVSIYEKGTTNGVLSDANGNYSLRYSNETSIIVFSYIGYTTQEIVAGNQTELNVKMLQGVAIKAVEIVGSRRLNRTSTQTPVAVDIIDIARVTSTSGQLDVNQLMQYLAPSFNSNKQSGADGADHIDPATLRGLGPDQTLVLINGKRRHQSSLINIYGTRGRGNTGTDLNALPASAIDHIEILRDGAAAQYGSDAIAGVINIVLKNNTDEFSGMVYSGMSNAKPASKYNLLANDKNYDGQAIGLNANYGVKAGKDGFINFTMDYLKKDHTNRAPDPAKNDVYRRQFGDAASDNFGLVMNSSFNAGDNTEIYAFGGYNYRFTDAYAYTRYPDEDRNVLAIYPDGFDPEIQSVITDKSMSFGVKSKVNGWNMDLNNTIGANKFHYYVDNTLNASLNAKSPTRFDAGGFSLLQNTTGLNFTKLYDKIMSGLNVAMGAEFRVENYQIFAGEEGSYKNYGGYYVFDVVDSLGNVTQDSSLRPSGSQGFPGFQPANAVNESRTNVSLYADAELDITKSITVSGAARFENYSDFGNTLNGKFAARFKLTNWLSLRGAVSTGFRAPSLAQLYFNSTYTDVVAGQIIDKIIAKNNSPITNALGIPALKEELSTNICGGITASYKAFSVTLDAYNVQVKDRIVLTGSFTSDDPDIGADLQALNVSAAQFFTNAVNTTTTGLDLVLAYGYAINNDQTLRFTVAGNFNNMKIDDIYTNDKLKGKENTYFGLREQYFLLASAPKTKLNFGINYSIKKFYVDLHLNQFGQVELINYNDNGDNVVDEGELDTYKPQLTVDLAVGYKFKNIQLTIGSTNLLNTYCTPHDPGLTESGGTWDAVQQGFSGAFYYAKLGFKF